jgi:hypothetical protein
MEPALGCRLLDHQAAIGCLTAVANSIDEALALLQQWERSGRRQYVAEM